MANEEEDLDQVRRDEIFVLCEIYPETCKEEDDVLTFEILEPEFNGKKIRFQVRFIESYPQISKPDYLIISDWLPNHLIDHIKDRLNEIWNENLNQPIVYLWIEAVKECILKWLEDCKSNDELAKSQSTKYQIDKIENKFTKLDVSNKNKGQTSKQERFDFKHGEPFVFKKSVFQAHLLKIYDESKIDDARRQLLEENKRVQEATHNIMAYRIIKTTDNRTIEHSNYDDDGENQAGSRLHLLLQLTDSKNVLVIVSRYFGGVKLGPDRFKYINEVAKVMLQEQGLVSPKEGKQSKGKKKK